MGLDTGEAHGGFKQIRQVSVGDQAKIFAASGRLKHFVLHLVDNVKHRGKQEALFFDFSTSSCNFTTTTTTEGSSVCRDRFMTGVFPFSSLNRNIQSRSANMDTQGANKELMSVVQHETPAPG